MGSAENTDRNSRVWVLTDETFDAAAQSVIFELDNLGIRSLLLSPQNVGELSVHISGSEIRVALGGVEEAFPAAVLNLRLPTPAVSLEVKVDDDQLRFHEHQWRIMLTGLLAAFEHHGCAMMNRTLAMLSDEKTLQMLVAAECGFATAGTLQTADTRQAAEFAELDPASALAMKPFVPFSKANSDRSGVRRLLTNIVDARALASRPASRVPTPAIFQPFVKACFEHRVVVVGDAVFGARVVKEGEYEIDVRRGPIAKANVEPSELPSEVNQRCHELLGRFDLEMASIDLLETADGYVFLDLNPSGHYYWVEQLTGQPISATIAQRLADLAQPARR